jgi:hypothetical protein
VYARVATFEGGDPSKIDETIDMIREQSAKNEEEIPAKEFMILVDRRAGKTMALGLFETEEDLRDGDAKLNAMSPPAESGMGQRSSVDLFEVALQQSVARTGA